MANCELSPFAFAAVEGSAHTGTNSTHLLLSASGTSFLICQDPNWDGQDIGLQMTGDLVLGLSPGLGASRGDIQGSMQIEVATTSGFETLIEGQASGEATCTNDVCDLDMVVCGTDSEGVALRLDLNGQFRIEHDANPWISLGGSGGLSMSLTSMQLGKSCGI